MGATGFLSMPSLPTPTEHETLNDYLSKFTTDDDRAAATLVFRTKAVGVKVLNEETGLLGGWGIPFGGPVRDKAHAAGKDLDGEYFDEKTNFCLDWFPNDNRPVLYDHGTDPEVKLDVIGRQVSKFIDSTKGVWVETQLDLANQYAKYVLELAKKGVLGYSSGALGGYVKRSQDGHITQWPWVEETVTVRPANPYALIASEAVKHLEMAGLLKAPELPPASLGEAIKSELVGKAAEQHGNFDGSHSHAHPAGGSQGDDTAHSHEHSHSGDDIHEHQHAAMKSVHDDFAGTHAHDHPAFDEKEPSDGSTHDHEHAHSGDAKHDHQHTVAAVSKPDKPEAKALTEIAAHLEANGWTRQGAKFSSRNMGQLHQSMKAVAELHGSTCDMGEDCPLAEAKPAKGLGLPDLSELETPERKKQRQEIDAFLATIKLGGK